MSKLLLDEKPLMILPQLAVKIGLNEAIILQQIHYWLLYYEKAGSKRHFKDGNWWVFNSYESWQDNFPFWSIATIKRALTTLRKSYISKSPNDPLIKRAPLLIATSKYNEKRYDKTLWYRIDYDALDAIEDEDKKPQVKMTHGSNCTDASGQNDPMDEVKMTQPIPETNIETTIEKELTPPDLFDLALKTQKARQREGGDWTVPPEISEVDPFADGPVDAFAEILAGITPLLLPAKERKSWALKLRQIAKAWSTEEKVITAQDMERAIRAIPDSNIGWKTYTSPYSSSFETDIPSLLLGAGPQVQKGTQHEPHQRGSNRIAPHAVPRRVATEEEARRILGR